ncbi:hypothetical protein Tco_0599521 [Tanacetum coccineum]
MLSFHEGLPTYILDGKLMFVNDDGKPLVPTRNVDSDSEVEVVFDETTNLMASTSFKCGSDIGGGFWMFKRNRMLKSPFSEFVRDDESIGLARDHGTKGFCSDMDQVINVDGNSTGALPEVTVNGDPSTTAHPTVSSSLDGTNGKQTNYKESSTAKNDGVEA